MLIAVGSLNPVKIKAVRTAFERFFPEERIDVKGVTVSSNVPDQPIGKKEILTGATNRAEQTLMHYRTEQTGDPQQSLPTFFIGIEAGFIQLAEELFIDIQLTVIRDSLGKCSVGAGSGLTFPKQVIDRLLLDRKTELGNIMAELTGNIRIKHEEGAVGFFSHGIITREEITRQSVEMALIPFISKSYYFPADG